MNKKWTWSQMLWATAAVALLVTGSTLFAAKGGSKGKPGGGEDPPPPPVRYQFQLIDMPDSQSDDTRVFVRDINTFGQAVGSYFVDLDGDGVTDTFGPFLYDPQFPTAQAVDLNEIVSGIPEGWSIRQSRAINVWGDICVHLQPKSIIAPENVQAAMIDMSVTPPQLHIIPDGDFTDFSIAADMNDWGDIVVCYEHGDGTRGNYVYNFGLYGESLKTALPIDLGINANLYWHTYRYWAFINNEGQVLGHTLVGGVDTPYRYSPEGGVEVFPELAPHYAVSINDAGEFLGRIRVEYRGNKTKAVTYVMGSELELLENEPDVAGNSLVGLNNSSDVAFKHTLLHRDWGYLDYQELLDPTDPNTAFWAENVTYSEIQQFSDRDSTTGFPLLTGVMKIQDTVWSVFILTPVLAP